MAQATVYFAPGKTTAETNAKTDSEDVEIVVAGPRSAFVVTSATNGMQIRFTETIDNNETLIVNVRERRARLRAKGETGGADATDACHVAPHQTGRGWMRVVAGRNQFMLTPL